MDEPGSVTRWIIMLQQGDKNQAAAAGLWQRYFQRLARVARAQLGRPSRAVLDESDIALEALHSFFQGVEEGRFADLQGRDELWRVLVVIAKRKAINSLRHELAQIRGGGKAHSDALLAEIAGTEPTPELTAALFDELQHILSVLREEDGTLCLIAIRKSEGHSNQEIAAELSVSLRTIERKLTRINILWAADLEKRFGNHD